MSLSEHILGLNRLQQFIDSGDLVEIALLPAAIELQETIKERVVEEGKNSQNTSIGKYSTRPLVVEKEQFIKPSAFKGKGKTMFLPFGYKELRDIQGLRTDIVNLKYSGQLVKDYQHQRTKDAILLGITTDRSTSIYNKLVEQYGYFFVPTYDETTDYLITVQTSLNKLTRNILKGGNITATID